MDAEIDLRSVWGLLRRRGRLVLLVLFSVLALAVVSLLLLTPVYTATTLVMVDPADKNLLLPQTQLGPSTPADARIEGEVLLAKSDNVLLAVIDRENLADDADFRTPRGLSARIRKLLGFGTDAAPSDDDHRLQALERLSSIISVQRHRATYFMSIAVENEDPERAASLANAVAQAYVELQVTSKVQSALDARNVLLEQVDIARRNMISSDGAFDRFIDDNLSSIIEETSDPELSALQQSTIRLAAQREELSQELVSLQALSSGRVFDDYSAVDDEPIASLSRERSSVLDRLSQADQGTVEDLRQQLARVEQDLETALGNLVSQRQAELRATQIEEASERQNLRIAVAGSGLSPDMLTQLYELQQRADLARQQYNQLLARSQQLQAESTLQLADSRIVSPALRPAQPSWPRPLTFLGLAAILGLALGFGLAFVYDHFIGGVTSEDELAGLAGGRFAQSMPRIRLHPDQHSVSDLVIGAPLSAFAEAVRRIRTSIDQSHSTSRDAGATVVVVTSASQGDGKTTAALALARSYALLGKRTLLIDCDLRQPALHTQLNLTPARGLIDVLTSNQPDQSLARAITKDDKSDLLVLVGSRRSAEATDQMVASRNFDELIRAARHGFDVVVLDTPALGPVVDGLYVSRKADIIVFMAQWAATSRQDIRKALMLLEGAVGKAITIIPVLNRIDQPAAAPYGYVSQYHIEPAV